KDAALRGTDCIATDHVVWVADIVVLRFGAEGRELKLAFPFRDHHLPELSPDRNRTAEGLFDLFGPGGSGDIVGARFPAQQEITHAAADPERREAGLLQTPDDRGSSVAQRFDWFLGHASLPIHFSSNIAAK